MGRLSVDNELLGFMTALNGAGTVDAAWDQTVGYMRGLGASHVHIGMELDQANPVLMWTSGPGVVEHYRAKVYPHSDPTLAHCREKMTPYFTGTALLNREDTIPCRFRTLLEDLASVEYRSAAVIPIHCAVSSDWGKVSFSTGQRAAGFKQIYARHGHRVQMAGTMAFNRVRTLLKRDRTEQVGLTDGERECLLWLASGLRRSEIADQLGIHVVTVNHHFKGARRKLKAKTLAQALVNAMQLGVIEP